MQEALYQREVTGTPIGGLTLARLYFLNGNVQLARETLKTTLRKSGFLAESKIIPGALIWTPLATDEVRQAYHFMYQVMPQETDAQTVNRHFETLETHSRRH